MILLPIKIVQLYVSVPIGTICSAVILTRLVIIIALELLEGSSGENGIVKNNVKIQ